MDQQEAKAAHRRLLSYSQDGRVNVGWKSRRDRRVVAEYLVALAWQKGDMEAALELGDTLADMEP